MTKRKEIAEIILYHGKDVDYINTADQILTTLTREFEVVEECKCSRENV